MRKTKEQRAAAREQKAINKKAAAAFEDLIKRARAKGALIEESRPGGTAWKLA